MKLQAFVSEFNSTHTHTRTRARTHIYYNDLHHAAFHRYIWNHSFFFCQVWSGNLTVKFPVSRRVSDWFSGPVSLQLVLCHAMLRPSWTTEGCGQAPHHIVAVVTWLVVDAFVWTSCSRTQTPSELTTKHRSFSYLIVKRSLCFLHYFLWSRSWEWAGWDGMTRECPVKTAKSLKLWGI